MSRGAARAFDVHLCPAFGPVGFHGGGPMIWPGAAPTPVMVEGQPALRLGDMGLCAGPPDVAIEGAAHVLVGGLPWVGRFHGTAHGGMLVGAAATVVLEGATFAVPSGVRILGPSRFRNLVIRDLFFLYATPSGRELWRRIAATEKTITIIPDDTPDNSWAESSDPEAEARGEATGAIIGYNPAIAVFVYDDRDQTISMPPQITLAHELIHALDYGEGRQFAAVDPRPPASEPDIEEAEACAIGTGSHEGNFPSENSFRRDLELPRRNDHYGLRTAAPTANFRPGGY